MTVLDVAQVVDDWFDSGKETLKKYLGVALAGQASVQYAIIYANGKLDGLGGDPEVLSQLLRKGDKLVRREVGPWEVIETWDGR